MIVAGSAMRPFPGFGVSGDAPVVIRRADASYLLALVDALGHGPLAAEAAQLAVATIDAHANATPRTILHACHAALRRGRGAAIAVVTMDARGNGIYAGVGNIRARIVPEGHRQPALLSSAGVVGEHLPPIRETSFRLPIDGLGLLHSDGIRAGVDPLAVTRGPIGAMAVSLLAHGKRETDDASLVLFAHAEGGRVAA